MGSSKDPSSSPRNGILVFWQITYIPMQCQAVFAKFRCRCSSPCSRWWRFFWRINIHPKFKLFFWRTINEGLSTKDILSKWVDIDPHCYFCHSQKESAFHILFECDLARKVWALGTLGLKPDTLPCNSVKTLVSCCFTSGLIPKRDLKWFFSVIIICYFLWNHRNKTLFLEQKLDKPDIPSIIHQLEYWIATSITHNSLEPQVISIPTQITSPTPHDINLLIVTNVHDNKTNMSVCAIIFLS
ncbi:uncharacterized protein LOC122064097 isoform X3 [Macadamia integrifolia]|uniref:uncharacterized protein LOC122064097 isoform X3 n=1 Tax=Macadamia integrifolia TaxID=60698 RepID=UPI001C4EB6DB|nr:uncharacterized protein LOC122064097 isoform X3 [Macadamia integrifolia]